MFARAVQDHQHNSSQLSSVQKSGVAIQKPLDFTSAKRKALDVIDDTNKRPAIGVSARVKQNRGSGLIAALNKVDSFVDTKGQVELDGDVFDEADFDDIGIEDWAQTSTTRTSFPVSTEYKTAENVQNSSTIESEENYFQEDDDMDWDVSFTNPSSQPNLAVLQTGQQFSTMPSTTEDIIQNQENTPPIVSPVATEPQSLANVLFPSSAPFPWSPTPQIEQKQPPKRSLPWVKNPSRYGSSPVDTTSYRKEKSQVKSIVRTDSLRKISTMAMEAPAIDWDVLGITEKDIFKQKKQERMEELQRRTEEMRRGTEWIDKAAPVEAAKPRRRRAEEKQLPPKQKITVGEKKPQIAKLFLSQEQLSVRKLVVEDKKSVFFTGSAGTGKSVLLREIINALKKVNDRNPEAVAVTASTGLAACNVGGITLHSFAAFGLGREAAAELAKRIKKNRKGFERWRRTRVLIIDEISMVDADFFDKLEELARIIRKDDRPFGGIQLVITGDFFQLPPVAEKGRESKFAFEAKSWSRCICHTIELTNVFRQKDQEFVTMLNEMRLGRLSQDSIMKFKALQRTPQFDDNIEPTELFPTRDRVDKANLARLHSLPGPIHSFSAEEGGALTNVEARERLLQNCMAPKVLELKKGAQVMLIKNMDENLVNGSLGKVIGFMSETTYSLCEHEGIDVDSVMDIDAKATAGDPYGFPTLDAEDGDSESVLRKKRRILKLRAMSAETTQLWPLVRFTTASGLHIDRLLTREKWSFEAPDGEVQAYRRQIPLILAYAISIHKAQGQTLSRVRVDLEKVFEKGQAYVALSRATSREGLQILRFDAAKVMAHPKVAGFYRSLETVNRALKTDAKEEKGWATKALEELQDREEDYELTSSYAYG